MDLGNVEERANKLLKKILDEHAIDIDPDTIGDNLKDIVHNKTVKTIDNICPPDDTPNNPAEPVGPVEPVKPPEKPELVFNAYEYKGTRYYLTKNNQLWDNKADLVGILDSKGGVIMFNELKALKKTH